MPRSWKRNGGRSAHVVPKPSHVATTILTWASAVALRGRAGPGASVNSVPDTWHVLLVKNLSDEEGLEKS